MPNRVQQKGVDYQQYQHTKEEQLKLLSRGLKAVISSNVSAIGVDELGLIVRFHGGATYRYPESGDLYKEMLNASSKGKFVWNELRRKHVPYYRLGKVSLENDIESTDLMVKPIEEHPELPKAKSLVTIDNVRNTVYEQETKPLVKATEVKEHNEVTKTKKEIRNTTAIALGLMANVDSIDLIAGITLASIIGNATEQNAG